MGKKGLLLSFTCIRNERRTGPDTEDSARAELGIADRGSCRIRATAGFNFMRLRIRFLCRLVALPA